MLCPVAMHPYGMRLRSRDSSCQMESITTSVWRRRTSFSVHDFYQTMEMIVSVLWDLNDQHVLPEVVPLFEDDAHRSGGGGWRHGGKLQPQRFLLAGHHFAIVHLDWSKTFMSVDSFFKFCLFDWFSFEKISLNNSL